MFGVPCEPSRSRRTMLFAGPFISAKISKESAGFSRTSFPRACGALPA